MAGYNPYRKSNGEFASKDEVGAVEDKVEADLREAELSGDTEKIAEIKNYAMDRLSGSPLGSRLLDQKYGSIPQATAGKSTVADTSSQFESAARSTVVEAPAEELAGGVETLPKVLSKPKRNKAMSHYELSDQPLNISNANPEDKFYDSDGRVYTLVRKTFGGDSATFRMTDTDGNPIDSNPSSHPFAYDTLIEANDQESLADMRKLVAPKNPIGSQERNPGNWTMPRVGAAVGSWRTGTERYSHEHGRAGDRLYDELGNVYTVTGKDGDFTELSMTLAGEKVTATGGTPMVLHRNDLSSKDALRKLQRPTILGRIRSIFGG